MVRFLAVNTLVGRMADAFFVCGMAGQKGGQPGQYIKKKNHTPFQSFPPLAGRTLLSFAAYGARMAVQFLAFGADEETAERSALRGKKGVKNQIIGKMSKKCESTGTVSRADARITFLSSWTHVLVALISLNFVVQLVLETFFATNAVGITAVLFIAVVRVAALLARVVLKAAALVTWRKGGGGGAAPWDNDLTIGS
jgi:energy-converting hydrogenase Eha subunit E